MKSLRYVTDSSRGITRHRKGRGSRASFTYRNTNGRPVTAAATLARIRALAIPPAYEDVWISPHPNGHLQATGRDARGRKQYRYHAKWSAGKDEIKHSRMHAFGRALPRLRRILQADLRKPGLPRDKVLALVVSLMDATCARIGNAEYARSNGSFGLSTLLDRHARFARNGVGTLHFPGKSGLIHDVRIENPKLAAVLRGAVMYVALNPWDGIGDQVIDLPGSLSPLPTSSQAYRTVSAGHDLVFVPYFTIDTERYNTYFRIA